MTTLNAIASYTCVDCTDIFNENELEHGACPGCDSTNIQLIEGNPSVEIAVVQVPEVVQMLVIQLPQDVRVSRHFNHPLCQELVTYMNVQPIETTLRNDSRPLFTQKEIELVQAFVSTGYNIKKTGEVVGCTHTNVWQRLYGQERNNAKGIIGKYRQMMSQ